MQNALTGMQQNRLLLWTDVFDSIRERMLSGLNWRQIAIKSYGKNTVQTTGSIVYYTGSYIMHIVASEHHLNTESRELQGVHVLSSPSRVQVLQVSSRVRELLGRTRVRVRVRVQQDRDSSPTRARVRGLESQL